jgi:DNA-binding NarL/FixJ family response regulator
VTALDPGGRGLVPEQFLDEHGFPPPARDFLQEANELPPIAHRTSLVLVDDSGDLRALYRFSLDRTDDFEVVGEATDGLEGLIAAQTHQPDLVLLDISMPVMDGLQALPLIVDTCPETAVVMLTGHGISSGLPQKTAALGAAGYILKGTPMRAVLDELREILAQRSSTAVPEPRADPAP